MRQSTIKKLFETAQRPEDGQARYRSLWEIDTEMGPMTGVHIPRSQKVAIIHEYREPGDGFNVYVAAEGNSVEECHKALGLKSS